MSDEAVDVETVVVKTLLQHKALYEELYLCDVRAEKHLNAGGAWAVTVYYLLSDDIEASVGGLTAFHSRTATKRMELRQVVAAALAIAGWTGPVYGRFRLLSEDTENEEQP
jgi:hypothetical protein